VGEGSRRWVADRRLRGRRRRGLIGLGKARARGASPLPGPDDCYDRAGLGRSPRTPPPYRIDDEADALRRELDRHRVTARVVLVAHSNGWLVATLVAATDPRIAGVVLVDANLAGFFDDAQIERLLQTYRPQFPALEQAAPELARVLIPLVEAYPATVERLRQVDIPAATPTIDIVAERTWVDTPEEIDAIR
jgi:pimeloyl-ACP methyl ester carboxylesterase